ncbi:MAG: TonB-dependent receptor [Blastocatellia bacterium]
MKKLCSAITTCLLLVSLSGPVFAQSAGKGALTGTVTDSTGGVVTNAKVSAKNLATGVSYDTQTTDAGLYVLPDLPVGTYAVSIEAPGFKAAKIENLVVTVGQTVTQNVTVEAGAPTESVTVTASGEQLVQSSEASLSTLLNRKVWESYPLENRDSNEFIDLLPGAVPDAIAGTTRGAAVNGARPGMGNFMVDGYDNNDQGQGGRGSTVAGGITSISPEAIQEYRIITNTYSAQYGKAGGFVADTVLKSGGNKYHGSLFEYNRVQALAANDFFSNRDGIQDSLVRNQFGGSFGGPIRKEKTFFFGSVEWHKLRQGAPVTGTSFTRQFFDFVNSGAFASFMEGDGLCGGTCPGAFSQSRTVGPLFRKLAAVTFPGGIPFATSQFSNVGAGLFTEGIVYPVPIYGQVSVTSQAIFDQYRVSTKIDHTFSGSDRISGTFLIENPDTTNTFVGGEAGTIGPSIVTDARRVNIGITYGHNFSATMLNEAKISYLRNRADFPQLSGFDGIPSVVTGIDPLALSFGQSSSLPQFFTDRQLQVQDHLSVIRGSHSFRAGGEYRRTFNASAFEATKNGLFLPHGVEELLTDGFFGDEADAVFGTNFGGFTLAQASVNPITRGLPEFYRGYRANEMAFYFQDDWKLKHNLTLNLGLRWEYFGPPHNFREGIDSNFYFGTGVTPVPNPSSNVFFPSNSPLIARLVTGSFQQRDHSIWEKDNNNFGPRVGFAWDVFNDQKLVVRGGGGMFYDRIWNNLFENIRFNAPFFNFSTIGAFGNGIAAGPLSTPGLFTVPFSSTSLFADPANLPAPSPRHMDQNLVTPFLYQAFLGVQREVAKTTVVEVNYITTLGRQLTGVVNINTFNGRSGGTLATTGRSHGSTRRPNPAIASDNFRTNGFTSSYHGGQVILRHRARFGLQLNSSYTYSKAIDTISDAFNARLGLNPTNNFNIGLDRGRADFDVRHKFVTDFSYEIPFFKENRWLGGWEATGIVTVQSGAPFSVFHGSSNEDANADGIFSDRAVFIGSGPIENVIDHSKSPADGFFDPTQFVGMVTRAKAIGPAAACGPNNGVITSNTQWWCDGTTGRNILTGPGFVNFDLGVHKRFRVTENSALQFQANAFNVFNHPNFGRPNGNLNSAATVGKSTFTINGARVMQLALRFDF